jgi:predicted ferric reductase
MAVTTTPKMPASPADGVVPPNGVSAILRVAFGFALFGLVLGGLGACCWLWVYDGALTSSGSASNLLLNLGNLAGLIGGYLLAVQVLLLVRLPFLEWVAGFDRLTRWHSLNGKACLYLIVAHVVLIVVGGAATDATTPWGELGRILVNDYGMVAALIGTVAIVAIALISFGIVRSRLPYETWYITHLLMYVGLFLVWFHETRTGYDFILDSWAVIVWTAMYVITFQMLLIFRLGYPIIRTYVHDLRVARVDTQPTGFTTITMRGRRLEWLNAQPGQFFIWRFLAGRLRWEAHPFSLSAMPTNDTFQITAREVGGFTKRLKRLPRGTRVAVEGPFGAMTASHRTKAGAVLIAGGVGITPLRALFEQLGGDLILIYRTAKEEDILFRRELDAIGKRKGARIHYVVGSSVDLRDGEDLGTDHLQSLVGDIVRRDVFLAGPPGFVRRMLEQLKELEVPTRHIHFEQFALA